MKRWTSRGIKIHKSAMAELANFQPYQHPNPKAAPLWLLNELVERDKRTIIRTVFINNTYLRESGVAPSSNATSQHERCESEAERTPLEKYQGADLIKVRARLPRRTSELGHDSSVHFEVAFEPTIFGGACYVRACMASIVKIVHEVIIRFETLLESNPHWT